MTNVTIIENENNIIGYIVSGHSGYAEEGCDIVCSAISSMSQSTALGLENVLNLKPVIKIKEKEAFLSVMLPNGLNKNQMQQAQILLQTFKQSVQVLLTGDKKLKKYISLEVKNEIH